MKTWCNKLLYVVTASIFSALVVRAHVFAFKHYPDLSAYFFGTLPFFAHSIVLAVLAFLIGYLVLSNSCLVLAGKVEPARSLLAQRLGVIAFVFSLLAAVTELRWAIDPEVYSGLDMQLLLLDCHQSLSPLLIGCSLALLGLAQYCLFDHLLDEKNEKRQT